MEPYFLGSERCVAFGTKTQRSLSNPYFLHSAKIPSQSALFGVLRYLGIRRPNTGFNLREQDKRYIGHNSFQLLGSQSDPPFGKIIDISPMVIEDAEGNVYLPAPRNHKAVRLAKKEKTADYQAYHDFISIVTLERKDMLIPTEYHAKDWDEGEFLCIGEGKKSGKLAGGIFDTQVRVGINRSLRDKTDDERKGFFKKEYIVMKPGYAFVYYARLQDDACGNEFGFTEHGSRLISMGQGKPAFAAEWETVTDIPSWNGLERCFPEQVDVDGIQQRIWYAYAKSNCYFDGESEQLRKHCALALADVCDYRMFTTNYGAKTAKERYTKHPEGLKLIKAGSVFLFRKEEQKQEFQKLLEQTKSWQHGSRAGLNQIYYSET